MTTNSRHNACVSRTVVALAVLALGAQAFPAVDVMKRTAKISTTSMAPLSLSPMPIPSPAGTSAMPGLLAHEVHMSTSTTSSKAVSSNAVSLKERTAPILDATSSLFRRSWWVFPMFLATVPLYCTFALRTAATMPTWWRVVPIQRLELAARTIAVFLGSNVVYFAAGLALIKKCDPEENNKYLGHWLLLSGLISTVFHSVQALGPYSIAESLCYIDHGVAITSGAYFLDTCGRPAKPALVLGIAGLFCLAISPPSGYAWLHSLWHVLSAASAYVWAVTGLSRRQQES